MLLTIMIQYPDSARHALVERGTNYAIAWCSGKSACHFRVKCLFRLGFLPIILDVFVYWLDCKYAERLVTR
jgi:hypothetical protein